MPIKQNELMSEMVNAITTRLNDLYIQYYNDFLSAEAFARYHGLSIEEKLFHCQRKVGFLTLYHGIPRHKMDKSGMPRGFTI